MSDTKKSCLGLVFIVAAVVLGVAALVAGSIGMDLRRGAIVGVATFVFFFTIAAYLFLKINNWGMLPVIAGMVYTILPDVILGPEDDLLAVLLGAVISAVLAWRSQRSKKSAELTE